MKKLLLICGVCLMLSGCGWTNRRNGNNNGSTNNGMNGSNNNGMNGSNSNGMNQGTNNQGKNDEQRKGNMQDLVNEFKSKGIQFENEQTLNSFDFAAHEGKSLSLNGETVYLYRLNMNDEKMKEWAKTVKEKNMVTVNQNGKDEEYSAVMNNDYLLVYRKNANVSPLDEVFRNYAWK